MSTTQIASLACRVGWLLRASLLALLVLLPAATAGAAGKGTGGWTLDPGLDLHISTYYANRDGASTTYPALGASLGLELSAPERPFAAGLFVDYELATREESGNVRLAGGWLRYRLGRLELATSAAHFASGGSHGRWMYAHKLQLEAWPGHKFAVEAIGAVGNSGQTALQMVYRTDLTQRVSLCITVGLGPDPLMDFGTSTRFVWNVH